MLDQFSPATREWFRASFPGPTAAQTGAWDAISNGDHTLVVAPTGSGKTLAAFLWALDRLAASPPPAERLRRCRVLYISPMKALAVDVERNLRSPLVGIGHAATRLDLPPPEVSVAVRSGDTPAGERRTFARAPTDVLITTPESLFLMLTSAARGALAGVETVIVDEVHAVAGTKRGAHLGLSLERLDALLERPAQRVGLSATVRPTEEVARFLAGGRPVTTVEPPSVKEWDLDVVVPVPDMADLAAGTPPEASTTEAALVDPDGADGRARASIWPHVEERVVDLVAAHRSTLVFANSRRLAERLTSRLNEIWQERLDAAPGQSHGAAPVLARAHHGSVSKEQRGTIEEDLKAGRLPAVVATSSLELGIDMGAVDLVIQVESPPSVASGLQRVGRAGHQVGAVSAGVLFPKYRGDLVQTAVVVERMRAGEIEALRVPANPVDVLAQQVVAMCAMEDWGVEDLETLIRRAASFTSLPRSILESVLDMLSGRYPSEEFAELRPRLVWDRVTGTLSGRRGAQRLAVTSGGTIPDRGLYGVYLASSEGQRAGGRRVGELDEEMVYESRVGDVFTLGTSGWRIEDITHDRVLVTPAAGQPGKLPFWKGDQLGRPAELGRAVGAFVREVAAGPAEQGRDRARRAGLDAWATDNLLGYLDEQAEATGQVPDDRTIVVERFRDEIGDWRVVIHSPHGSQVHAPWALCLAARLRERYGVDVQAMHGDDGIVLRLPDLELDGAAEHDTDDTPKRTTTTTTTRDLDAELAALIALDPEDVHDLVTTEIGGSALFASRFRECAARALLLPRRRPDQRQALWQQRQRSAQLLEVAARYPSFPIILETVRECVQDVFDVPGLAGLMGDLAARRVRMLSVETARPSPFAHDLLFGYVAQFLYEGDSPLAERRAAALALDPTLLAELLGQGDGAALRDLLDPEAVRRTEAELQRLAAGRRCRDSEDVADLLRALGAMPAGAVLARSLEGTTSADVDGWLTDLQAQRRVIAVRIAGQERWAAVEDAGRLRDALGVAVPVGVPDVFTEPVADPLGDLVSRYARTHGPFTIEDLVVWFGLGRAVVAGAVRRLVSTGRLVEGELRPLELTDGGGSQPPARPATDQHPRGQGPDFCDAEVLRTLRRRSLAALRAEVEPVPEVDYARFLPAWHGVATSGMRGTEGVLRVVEQLAGARLPASAVETLVLPGRVADYRPALLDELMAGGEVLWQGHRALPGDDGWVSLHLADTAALTLTEPDPQPALTESHQEVLEALAGGGAYFFRVLADAVGSTEDQRLAAVIWDLVWAGYLTNDTLAPLRSVLSGGRTAHSSRRTGPRAGRWSGHPPTRSSLGALGRPGGPRPRAPSMPSRTGPPAVAGRWSLLPERESDQTVRSWATAEVLLDRYGVVTRGAVAAEGVPGGFAGVYRVLATAEESGRVRRGYFIEHLGAAQFATTGAVDRLRAQSRPLPRDPTAAFESARREAGPTDGSEPGVVVVAAADPANPYGAALPWPDPPAPAGDAAGTAGTAVGHRPGRKAGSLVVLVDGELVLYVERGGRTLLSFDEDPAPLAAAARALGDAVRQGSLGRLTVEKVNGGPVLGSGHPVAAALLEAGFHTTPRGLRLRR